jgi:hypothetical protein
LGQKRHFFTKVFGENILKIITSVPGSPHLRPPGQSAVRGQHQDQDLNVTVLKVLPLDGYVDRNVINVNFANHVTINPVMTTHFSPAKQTTSFQFTLLLKYEAAGRPDWGNFRPTGDCSLWDIF